MKKNFKELIAITLISIILIPIGIPILTEIFKLNSLEEEDSDSSYYNPEFDNFLYINNVTSSEYSFNAKGECYILTEVEEIGFTNFSLDGQIFNVSYGLNIIPLKFQNLFSSHQIILTPEYFKSLTVEPLFLVENTVETMLDQDTEINFQAGGPISILVRPTFVYNWLYVELKNLANNESTLLKRIHNTADYPEIDPLFYCLFIERGTYIRYDINLEPGNYKLILRGDGQLDYKLLVNSDWDGDYLNNVDEIQQNDFYEEFDLDPTIPDIWGFFEKSDETVLYTSIEGEDFTEGFFSFYVPEIYTNNELLIEVNSGEFKDFIIDDDHSFLKGEVLNSNRTSPPDSIVCGEIEAGWHYISYKHKSNYTSEIKFLVNNDPIKVITISELKDTDGDGIKDLQEHSNSLNPSKIDTDEDGIPDNLDGSPLAKLELNPQKIHQIVVPTGPNDDTIIDIQIKKPINDYSTNGAPRLWRGDFNVSIYPVLRMFGNKYDYLQSNNIISRRDMNKQKLSSLWGKDVDLLLKSVENYDENGIGDSLPTADPLDYDSEFHFIFPKPAIESIEYSVTIPHGHSSKNDGRLDIRFDIIWLVTHYDSITGQTSLLHYYDFEEPIFVQSMTKREVSNVDYILGSPDCFIENQILWTLTQNPTLGTPEEFGVSDDIVGSANVNYFDLGEHTALDRTNTPLEENETEVLYIAGSYQNYDILNKIHLNALTNPDFATTHQGDFEVHFSSYSVSDLYEDQEYFIGDSEIQGENKILYQIYYHDIPEYSDVQRASIIGIPVTMELFENSNVLKITHAQGHSVPLDQIPWDDSQFGPKITIQHLTYIERDKQNSGIPLINFEQGVDICKEFVDNRIQEVERSNLFFISQPHMPAESFQTFIDEYWNQINSIDNSISLLSDLVYTASFPKESLEESINLLIDKIDNFKQHSFSDLNCYDDFFQFTQILMHDTSNLIISLTEIENQNIVPFDFSELFIGLTLNCAEEIIVISEYYNEKLVSKLEILDNDQIAENKIVKFKSKIRNVRIALFGWGTVCAVLGALMIYSGIQEILQLAAGKGDYSDFEYSMRLAKAIGITIAGGLLAIESLLLIASSLKTTWASALSKAIAFLGILALVVSAVLFLIDSISFFNDLFAGEAGPAEYADFIMSALSLASTAMIVAGGALLGAGIVLGLSIALACFLVWLIDHLCNDPHITLMNDLSKVSFPSQTKTNMRRHGGLEVGDFVNFRLAVDNDGKNGFWMRGKFNVFCDEWEGSVEDWKGVWADGANNAPWYGTARVPDYDEDFTSRITGATSDLQFRLIFQADYRTYSFWDDIWGYGYTRNVGVRQTVEESLNMPVLENTISSFYSNTDIYFSYATLLQEFNSAVDQYQYKDAYDFSRKTQLCVEKNRLVTLEQFESLPFYNVDAWVPLNPDLEGKYLLTAYTEAEFFWLLYNHYKDGWRAVIPNPYYVDDFYAHLFGYSTSWLPSSLLAYYTLYRGIPYSNLAPTYYGILVPKMWVHSAEDEFSAVKNLLQLGSDLPIKTNIETDLKETTFKVRPVMGVVNVSLNLLLDGQQEDKQKEVTFDITPPEGFSISPQSQFTGQLSSTIDFTFIHDSGAIVLGAYFFDVCIYLGTECIFEESVAMEIKGYSLVEYTHYEATDPIIPGDFFQAIDVINSGTYDEVINVSIEGIPESFIYKGLYPDDPLENIFPLGLGESRIALMINPPRHYTTSPGLYTYTFWAQDHVYGSFEETIIGTFEVAEFYDMDFQCMNPEINIFDYQTDTYTFNLTNLGNVAQEFQISFDDISFADENLSEDTIYLTPGESQLITLTLTPTGWGEQNFSIHAISAYNSNIIDAKITIVDDDVNPPEITGFEIIDTSLDFTVNFAVLNEIEGDDQGVSNILIYIDNILILNYIPDSTETNFSFTFNDQYGDWLMEYGTHEIRIEVIDNDDDVIGDELTKITIDSFNTTASDMLEYVLWELNDLESYIDENVYFPFDWILTRQLDVAECKVQFALDSHNSGCDTLAIIMEKLAKSNLDLLEFKTSIFSYFSIISDNVTENIIIEAQEIRDHITLTMGALIGTEISFEIAHLIIDIEQFSDIVKNNYSWCVEKVINCNLRNIVNKLENSLIFLSMDCECLVKLNLNLASAKLQSTIKKINLFECIGKLSESEASELNGKIQEFEIQIQDICEQL